MPLTQVKRAALPSPAPLSRASHLQGAAALAALAAGGRRALLLWALSQARGVAAQATPTAWPTGTPGSGNVFTQQTASIFYTYGTGLATGALGVSGLVGGGSGLKAAGALEMPYTVGSTANNAACVTQSCVMAAFGFTVVRQHGAFTVTSVTLPASRRSSNANKPRWVVQVWNADATGRPTTRRQTAPPFEMTGEQSSDCSDFDKVRWTEITGLSLTIPGGGYYAVVVYMVAGFADDANPVYFCALSGGANNNGSLGGTTYMGAYSSANYGATWNALAVRYGIVIRGSWTGAEGSGTSSATATATRSSLTTASSSGTPTFIVAAQVTPTAWPTGTPVSGNVFTQQTASIFYTFGTGLSSGPLGVNDIDGNGDGLVNAGALQMPYTVGSTANNAACVTQSCVMAAFGFTAFRQHGAFTVTSVTLPASRSGGGGSNRPSWVVQVWNADAMGKPTTLWQTAPPFQASGDQSSNCEDKGEWTESPTLSLTIPGGGYYAVVVYLVAGNAQAGSAFFCAVSGGANSNGALGGTAYMAAYSSASYGISWSPLAVQYGIVIRGSWTGAEGSGTSSATATATRSSIGTASALSSGTTTQSSILTFTSSATGSTLSSGSAGSTASASGEPTASSAGTATASGVPTATSAGAATASGRPTATSAGTTSAGGSGAPTPTNTGSGARTFTATCSASAAGTATSTPTGSAASSGLSTPPPTGTASASATISAPSTPTLSGSSGGSPTASATATPSGAATRTPPQTGSAAFTQTASSSPTGSAMATATGTPSATATPTLSGSSMTTLTASSFATRSGTATSMQSLSDSASSSTSATRSPTGSAVATATPSATDTLSGAATSTQSRTGSAAFSPSSAATPTGTAVATATRSAPPTSTLSGSSCGTASSSATNTLSGAATSTQSLTWSAAFSTSSMSTPTGTAVATSTNSAPQTPTLSGSSCSSASSSATETLSGATTNTQSRTWSAFFSTSSSATPTGTAVASATRSAPPTSTRSGSSFSTASSSAVETPSGAATSTQSLTWSSVLSTSSSATPTGTAVASATHSAPPTATLTGSSSGTLSASPTATLSGTATSTQSLSGSATSSRSSTRSPRGTALATATQTAAPTPSLTGSSTSTLSPSTSATLTSTATSTQSPSDSAAATHSATFTALPTGTASPTATSTLTATPSKTPPRFSCLSRPGGCAQPALSPAWPLTARGTAVVAAPGAPPAAFAAWPFLSAVAALSLPLPPAPGEVVTVTCQVAPEALAVALSAAAPPLALCSAPSASALCFVVPAQGAPGVSIPLLVTLPGGGALAPPAAAPFAQLTCELRSAFASTGIADPRQLPRYGGSTRLSLPLTVLPAYQPHLVALLMESRGVAGTFRVLGGGGAGTVLPRVGPPAPPFNGSAPLAWDSPLLNTPAGAPLLAPLLAALAPFQALTASPPAPLSVALSASAHLLLLLPPAAPLIDAPSLVVALNGVPCVINWVANGGSVVSVRTPPLSQLCGATTTDCGTAVLVLRRGAGDPLDDVLSALRAAGVSAAPRRRAQASRANATLFIPAAYPPLPLPAPPAAPHLAALALPDLLAFARAATPAGAGFFPAEACTDPAFAAAEDCALVGGLPPPPPPPGTVCAYGAGAACAPCPTDRALCPGGNTLLPKPGFWAPLPNSPPGDLVQCPPPAAARCPGWAPGALGARPAACAAGYAGASCAACAPGFFPLQGACSECSPLSSLAAPLQFIGGLAALGGALFLVAQHALAAQRRGRAPPPLCGEGGSLPAVGALLVWAWAALQTLSALFSQAVADRTVPPPLVGAFSAFSALQFQGVAAAPACSAGGDPFASLWAATGAAYGAVGVGTLCVAALSLLPPGRPSAPLAPPPRPASAARAALALVALFFAVGYGALVGIAVSALACSAPTALSVADYAATRGDSAALAAQRVGAFGAPLPTMALLRSAAADPVFAAQAGLAQLLASQVSVPLLAADPNTVCGEGVHIRARAAGLALLILLAGGLPALVLGSLFAAGELKGLRRLWPGTGGEGVGGEGGEKAEAVFAAAPQYAAAEASSPPTAPTPASLVVAALWKKELTGRAQWLTAQDWLLTALCTGATTYAGTAATLNAYLACVRAAAPLPTLPRAAYAHSPTSHRRPQLNSYQMTMAVALLGSALLLWRLQPSVERLRWQTTIRVALCVLAGAAACANAALRYALAPGGAAALALCATLLAFAACILGLLLLWWWSLLGGRREQESAALGAGEADEPRDHPAPPALAIRAAAPAHAPHLASSPIGRGAPTFVLRQPALPQDSPRRHAPAHTTWNPIAERRMEAAAASGAAAARPLSPAFRVNGAAARSPVSRPNWAAQLPRSRSRGKR